LRSGVGFGNHAVQHERPFRSSTLEINRNESNIIANRGETIEPTYQSTEASIQQLIVCSYIAGLTLGHLMTRNLPNRRHTENDPYVSVMACSIRCSVAPAPLYIA
jgi:hypothetical protein